MKKEIEYYDVKKHAPFGNLSNGINNKKKNVQVIEEINVRKVCKNL